MEYAGNFFLSVAALAAGLAVGLSGRGLRLGALRSFGQGRAALSVSAWCLAAATGLLGAAFLSNDFRLRAVQSASSRFLPLGFKISLLWVDLETSLLFWTAVLAAFLVLGSRLAARLSDAGGAWATIWAGVLVLVFSAMLLLRHNPFDAYLVERPLYGADMRPMLRNFWMLVHPPVQYLGYASASIPALLLASRLLEGRGLDQEFLGSLRPWLVGSWLALGAGMVLGMVWAYEELDWGGYWSWDPVENASLMPFLAATIALHATWLGRSGLKWLVPAAAASFWLTVFGAFVTRSGVLDSVHAFGQDRFLAYGLGGLLLVGAVATGALLALRRRLWWAVGGPVSLRQRFLVLCNWTTALGLVVVFVGSAGPLVWKLLGRDFKVGRSFYEMWMGPVGIAAVGLLGLGALPWGSRRFRWAVVAGLAGLMAGFAGGWQVGVSPLGLAGAAGGGFVLGVAAAWLLRVRGPRRAAALVHAGVGFVFFVLAYRGVEARSEVMVRPGEEFEAAGRKLVYLGSVSRRTLDRDVLEAALAGRDGELRPRLVVFLDIPEMPLSRGDEFVEAVGDLQVRLRGVDQAGAASLQVVAHPYVSWLWVGFGLMGLGGLLLLRRPELRLNWRDAVSVCVWASCGAAIAKFSGRLSWQEVAALGLVTWPVVGAALHLFRSARGLAGSMET